MDNYSLIRVNKPKHILKLFESNVANVRVSSHEGEIGFRNNLWYRSFIPLILNIATHERTYRKLKISDKQAFKISTHTLHLEIMDEETPVFTLLYPSRKLN
jgi:hypothetical protein